MERDEAGKYVSFRVFLGKKVALNWYIIDVPVEATFSSIAEDIKSASDDDGGLRRFVVRLPKDIPLPKCYVGNAPTEAAYYSCRKA